jgi:hypothetical protein
MRPKIRFDGKSWKFLRPEACSRAGGVQPCRHWRTASLQLKGSWHQDLMTHVAGRRHRDLRGRPDGKPAAGIETSWLPAHDHTGVRSSRALLFCFSLIDLERLLSLRRWTEERRGGWWTSVACIVDASGQPGLRFHNHHSICIARIFMWLNPRLVSWKTRMIIFLQWRKQEWWSFWDEWCSLLKNG